MAGILPPANVPGALEIAAMPHPQRICQRDLARRLGFSQATVSRALARHARIPVETRELVLREAERLGYRPDPALASLNAYRRTRQPISQGQSLAWLGTSPNPPIGDNWNYELELFCAARRCAEKLGYSLNYFWRHDPDLSLDRLEKIFVSRGIVGVIIGPQARAHTRIRLNIEHFAVVAVGRSLFKPPVDLVSTDHFQTMETCYRRMFKLGYRRIAFSLVRSFNERLEGIWHGAFLGQQVRRPALAQIPAFLGRDDHDPSFAEWLRAWRPDSIITMSWELGCLGTLARLGVRAPEDIGLALLAVPEADPAFAHYSGMREPVADLARFTVDVLVGRIRNNEKGAPADRRVHMLPGEWRVGTTTRSGPHSGR